MKGITSPAVLCVYETLSPTCCETEVGNRNVMCDSKVL
jgi:hypothetical protein